MNDLNPVEHSFLKYVSRHGIKHDDDQDLGGALFFTEGETKNGVICQEYIKPKPEKFFIHLLGYCHINKFSVKKRELLNAYFKREFDKVKELINGY